MTSHPDHPKKPINLLRGWPSARLLPTAALAAASQRLLADPALATPALLYGPDPGFEPLRGALAAWLAEFYYGTEEKVDVERVAVSGGASQSVACILQSFTDPAYTRAVWMVAPCYFLACPIFADAGFGARMRAVPEDEEGIDLAVLEAGLRKSEEEENEGEGESEKCYKDPSPHRKLYRHVIYCVPSFSNPSGKTMSLRRREGLLELARRYDALVICDDVYDMLQWQPTTTTTTTTSTSTSTETTATAPPDLNKALLPRLTDLERNLGKSPHDPPGKHFGHAVSNGSFSKLAGPGLRTGWTESTPDFAHGLSQTGSTRSGGAPSQFAAAVVYELLVSGALAAHLRDALRPAYRRRHRLVFEAARRRLAPLYNRLQQQQRPGEEEGGGGGKGREAMMLSSGGDDDMAAMTTGMARSLAGRDDVFGGYFVWFRLPGGLIADEVAKRCQAEENLAIGTGPLFAVQGDSDGPQFEHEVRLCFAWEDEADLEDGVTRLGSVVGRMLRGEPMAEVAAAGGGGGGGGGKRVDELK
ncbi:aminotransferase [Apiospora phragmitis]|uniref:Aminotransferase n=1 Tax=Apiospora phragmitis TaxID=2905665 RepID=A0ABR1T916_9PEZI